MTRILVCDECGEVLAVGDLDGSAKGWHTVDGVDHVDTMLLETEDHPPADADGDAIIAWAVGAAPDAAEVGAGEDSIEILRTMRSHDVLDDTADTPREQAFHGLQEHLDRLVARRYVVE